MASKEPVGLLGCWLLGCGQKIIKVFEKNNGQQQSTEKNLLTAVDTS